MSEALQNEIDRLNAANAKLSKDLAGLSDELKETRGEARDRRHEAKSLTQQLTELTTDRDRYKAAAEADPDNLKKQLADTANKLRSTLHERAFERVAKGLKVSDPTKLADLMKLGNYESDGDEPDESKITSKIQEVLKSRPWLVDEPEADASKLAPGGAHNVAKSAQHDGKSLPGADRGRTLNDGTSKPRTRPVGVL